MKYISVFIAAVLLLSLCIAPAAADESGEGWEQYFFLPKNGLDLSLIYKYLGEFSTYFGEYDKTNWERIQEDLQPYNAKLNFEKAYNILHGNNGLL